MATIERTTVVSPDRRRTAWIALAGLAAFVAVMAYYFLRPVPQLGGDERVFRTVDALFTAVTARDEKRIGECERRLQAYREDGKLPAAAADSLDAVIRKARAGGWQSAAEHLYTFISGQRREGVDDAPPRRDRRGPTRRS